MLCRCNVLILTYQTRNQGLFDALLLVIFNLACRCLMIASCMNKTSTKCFQTQQINPFIYFKLDFLLIGKNLSHFVALWGRSHIYNYVNEQIEAQVCLFLKGTSAIFSFGSKNLKPRSRTSWIQWRICKTGAGRLIFLPQNNVLTPPVT